MSRLVAVIGVTVAFAVGIGSSAGAVPALRVPARVAGGTIEARVDGRWQRRFWAGVNLGATVPGRAPGELAATRADYDRWLRAMGELGASVVRVYTILRPAFYDALAAYDRAHPDRPIWLLHGVWIPEEQFLRLRNLYAASVTSGFRHEIADAVKVVHGDADLAPRKGHAGGRYRSDVSKWLLGWSIGVEWDPSATAASDRKNRGRRPFHGRYFRAVHGSTPTESWLASMLDYLAGLEAGRGWSRPLTFTNWLTTDPLHHPREPLRREDLVSIDAMHVAATRAWPGGFFASYHAYPYYPDFLRLDPSYLAYHRPGDDRIDPYAGYLAALRRHHRGQAVMITEFGVPSSLGMAHLGPLGRNQGDHSEREAAKIDATLLRDIRSAGFSGGILFEWIDEWFKFTWNTIDLEVPSERRALWRNLLTNEEHFGVIAAEPGARQAVVLDGDGREWTGNGSQAILESRRGVREVRVVKDEEALYLRVVVKPGDRPLTIGFDVRHGGNGGLPGLHGVDRAADVAVVVRRGRDARILQAAWTDPIAFLYGLRRHYVPARRADLRVGSGVWVEPRLILNRPYRVPTTRIRRPVELQPLGRLRFGTTDPRKDDFDNRSEIAIGGDTIELRIPWALLGFADPSSRRALVPHPDGTITTEPVARVGIAVAVGGRLQTTRGYAWEPWNRVAWHERRKAGWDTLAGAFRDARAPG